MPLTDRPHSCPESRKRKRGWQRRAHTHFSMQNRSVGKWPLPPRLPSFLILALAIVPFLHPPLENSLELGGWSLVFPSSVCSAGPLHPRSPHRSSFSFLVLVIVLLFPLRIPPTPPITRRALPLRCRPGRRPGTGHRASGTLRSVGRALAHAPQAVDSRTLRSTLTRPAPTRLSAHGLAHTKTCRPWSAILRGGLLPQNPDRTPSTAPPEASRATAKALLDVAPECTGRSGTGSGAAPGQF